MNISRLFSTRVAAFVYFSMLIESPANPTVKALRSLELQRGRQARRPIPLEGVRAVEEALRGGALARSVHLQP